MPTTLPGLVRWSSESTVGALNAPDGLRLQNHLGEAEIENLRHSTTSPENVRRLDVAMNDAFVVGRLQSVADLNRNVQE